MIHKEFWGLLFLAFVGWVFIPGHPTTRIEHACRPIGWTGNVIVSGTALILPDTQKTVQGWFDRFEYGCQYTTWRLIYQDEYNKEQESLRAQAATKAASSASAPASAPAKKAGK